MSRTDNNPHLLTFSKHIPCLLIKQTIGKLAESFMSTSASIPTIEPSLERFHGALLFVDISGFTQLAIKMNVDDLRTHINAYFTLIINIVHKHSGDVVKFAGDALYIVWQVALPAAVDDLTALRSAQKAALQQAAACGTEINEKCTDYRISVQTEATSPASRRADGLRPLRRPSESDLEVVFLNVHAGLSCGMMAGMTIGSADRWEYLLLGQPLQSVALAESQASKGQLVLCPAAHALLHETCSCAATPQGCFVLSDHSGSKARLRRPRSKLQVAEALLDYEASFQRTVHRYLQAAFAALVPDGQAILQAHGLGACSAPSSTMLSQYPSMNMSVRAFDEDSLGKLPGLSSHSLSAVLPPPMGVGGQKSALYEGFLLYVRTELTNVLAKHVHEVARQAYKFAPLSPRYAAFQPQEQPADEPEKKKISSFYNPLKLFFGSKSDEPSAPADCETATVLLSTSRSFRMSSLSRKPSELLLTDLTAELRNVIVVFISISFSTMCELHLGEHAGKVAGESEGVSAGVPGFHFLPRTTSERSADQELLSTFQTCYTTLHGHMTSKGGQLRQFIIDDKGIVCIGTFGLRGSNNDDNAASAVEACHEIQTSLRRLQIGSSIGVTSGKVYCGLVGSLMRHEFAVMGPSVNLSARLMAKASAGGEKKDAILCDQEIRTRDRVHDYESLGSIEAKGYAEPVAIFSPLISKQARRMSQRLRNSVASTRSSAVCASSRNSTRSKQRSSVSNDGNALININQALKVVSSIRNSILSIKSGASCTTTVELALRALEDVSAAAAVTLPTTLQGREAEMESILQLVCPVGADKLDVLRPSLLVSIQGAQSIGRSLLLQSACKTISSHSHSISQLTAVNATVHYTVLNNFLFADAFSAWKGIFPDIVCVLVHRIRSSSPSAAAAVTADLSDMCSMEAALGYLREHSAAADYQTYSSLLPLLGLQSLATEASDNTSSLSLLPPRSASSNLLQGFMQYIIAVFQKLIVDSGMVVVVAFDDLQWLDINSWKLLKRMLAHCTGVVFLTTFRPCDGQHPNRSPAASPPLGATRKQLPPIGRLARGQSILRTRAIKPPGPSVRMEEIMQADAVPLVLQLRPLSASAIALLVAERCAQCATMSASAIATLSQRIFQLSGGHPMYAHELTKIAIERWAADPTDASSSHWSRSFQCGRMEEVICYRFDQLDLIAQAVLKAASVICANGAHCTIHSLAFVLSRSNYLPADATDTPMAGLQEVIWSKLHSLLERRDFLKVLPARRASSIILTTTQQRSPPTSNACSSRNPHDTFMAAAATPMVFLASVEQHAIYHLMVDDQREHLHRHVADYYAAQCLAGSGHDLHALVHGAASVSSPAELMEQGRHYELAGMHSEAFLTYHRLLVDGHGMEHVEHIYEVLQEDLCCKMEKLQKFHTSDNSTFTLTQQQNEEQEERMAMLCKQPVSFLKQALHVVLLMIKSTWCRCPAEEDELVQQLLLEAQDLMHALITLEGAGKPILQTACAPAHALMDALLRPLLCDLLHILHISRSNLLLSSASSTMAMVVEMLRQVAGDPLYVQVLDVYHRLHSSVLVSFDHVVNLFQQCGVSRFLPLNTDTEMLSRCPWDSIPFLLAVILQHYMKPDSEHVCALLEQLLGLLPHLDGQLAEQYVALALCSGLVHTDRCQLAHEIFTKHCKHLECDVLYQIDSEHLDVVKQWLEMCCCTESTRPWQEDCAQHLISSSLTEASAASTSALNLRAVGLDVDLLHCEMCCMLCALLLDNQDSHNSLVRAAMVFYQRVPVQGSRFHGVKMEKVRALMASASVYV